MPRELQPCGTPAAYRRHLRRGEPACRACLDAEAERQRPEGAPPRAKPRHGTASMYNAGCRCVDCTQARRVTQEAWRVRAASLPRDQVPHGLNGYRNYRCLCPVCRAAGSRDNRAYRETRRSRREAAAP